MTVRYLSTKLATEWARSSDRSTTILEKILWFIPKANPSYDSKLDLVCRWLIEFPDGIHPEREIGLDEIGNPVISGPNDNDYGFWLDTNMTYEDFKGDSLTKQEFEEFWARAQHLENTIAEQAHGEQQLTRPGFE